MADEFRYGWDANRLRYIDLNTGRFVSKDTVLTLMQERIDAGFADLKAFSTALVDGTVDIAEWTTSMMTELKNMHTQLAALGKGGWDAMTPSDWGTVGSRLRSEYDFLRGFSNDIASGRLSAAQIEMRADLYAEHGWLSYWEAATNAAEEAPGLTQERRVLSGAESCPDCEAYAAEGWQPIGTLPDPGEDSVCQANCKCEKEYAP